MPVGDLKKQANIQVDAMTGASNSGNNFLKLADAVLRQAVRGDLQTVRVE